MRALKYSSAAVRELLLSHRDLDITSKKRSFASVKCIDVGVVLEQSIRKTNVVVFDGQVQQSAAVRELLLSHRDLDITSKIKRATAPCHMLSTTGLKSSSCTNPILPVKTAR
jgi:hypothetical protein